VDAYQPRLPIERVERLRRWHEEASTELHRLGAHDVEYLGLRLHIPEQVFPPTPTSDLLGREVLAHAQRRHRVLDMGCGAGANAILAARRAYDVVGVDINPVAVAASGTNAERNGVADRTRFAESDVFEAVEGEFDLIVFDPPFRWFRPRDLLEHAIADENYASLTRFMGEVADRLRPGGEVLVFFGTSGDIAYFDELIDGSGLVSVTIAERSIHARGETATYFVRRLTRT
jgi:release factor glutamine methyltransferase